MSQLVSPVATNRRRTAVRVVMLAGVMLASGGILTAGRTAAFAAQVPADAALFARLDADGDGQVSPQEVPVEHRQLFERLIRKSDVNHDRKLARDEFLAGLVPSQAAKPLDEKLPAEFPGADAIRWLLLSMDTNADGTVNSAEVPEKFSAAFQAMSAQIDKDKNNILDRQELSQAGRQLSNIATRVAQQQQVDVAAELKKLETTLGASFDRFDGPQRGRQPQPPGVGLGNPLQARQTFAQLDANGDGQITLAEVPESTRPNFRRLLQVADRDGNGRLSEQEFVTGIRQTAGRRGGPRAGGLRGQPGGTQPALDALRPGNLGDGTSQAMDAMPGNDEMPGKNK